MAAKTTAAQAIRRALDDELRQNAAAVGVELGWSAAELEVLDLIEAHATRRSELQATYEACDEDQIRTRLAVATELRLTEVSLSRLLKMVSTTPPQPMSVVSQKAQKAARSRWDRERRAGGI